MIDLSDILDTIAAVSGATVTYHRGGDSSVEVTAILGKTEFEELDAQSGSVIVAATLDFLINVDDMEVVPAIGDTITYGTRTCLVANVPGRGCYQFSDATHTVYRIHTREADR